MTALLTPFLIYVIATFAIAFVWHLHLFGVRYRALAIYREKVQPQFGLLSMIIQGVCFALVYNALFVAIASFPARAIEYGIFGAAFSWSFTTLAVAAKSPMRSIKEFIAIETAFTIVQWAVVAALTAALA